MTKVIDQKTGQPHGEFYVYTWHRPDKDEIFYVGKGKGARAGNTYKRNSHFKNILRKLADLGLKPIVSRVADGLTEAEAFELEIELIAKYKRVGDGGTLCNMTIGGDGAAGVIKSEDSRRKTAESVRKALSDPDVRAKISERGYKRYEDPQARIAHGLIVSKRYEDPAEREKMSIPLRGKPKTNEHVENVRTALVEAWGSEELRESHRRKTLMRGPTKANRSGYKGVSFDKSKGKWLAQAEVSGRNKHLGRYDSAEDAAKAYDQFVVSFYGRRVYTNFPIVDAANDNSTMIDKSATVA